MNNASQDAHLYQLALSMGTSQELEVMLDRTLKGLMEHLPVRSAQVWQLVRHQQEIWNAGLGEEARCLLTARLTPLNHFPNTAAASVALSKLEQQFNWPEYYHPFLEWAAQTLPMQWSDNNRHQVLFSLPGFGLLWLETSEPLEAELHPEQLQPLMDRLAQFCLGCLSQAQLAEQMQKAQQASQAKSLFLANMSHEIRTPMNGILGMLDLVLHSELNEEQKEYLDLARMSADHLLEIINHLLDLSKIEAGKLDLQPKTFDLIELLGQTVKSLAARAKLKRLQLHYDIDPNLPRYVMTDPARLRQMLINLLGNAIKFTQVGEVTLEARLVAASEKTAELELVVRDTGIGMDAATLEHIFEPFEQAQNQRNRQFEGTGLGLSIVKDLAELMGGRIQATSQLQQGSCFRLQLPIQLMQASDHQPVRPCDLSGFRVLLTEDHPVSRRVISAMLQQLGLEPGLATSGPEALFQLKYQAQQHQPYDAVLVDAHLPGMDGFRFVEQLRQEPQLAATQVLMLSASAETGDAKRCHELGLMGYLTKPLTLTELQEALQRLLAQHQPQTLAASHPTGFKILLAEDNQVNMKLAMKLLARDGHQVSWVEDGEAALDQLRTASFDLVLMDMMMPVMDGLEATRQRRLYEQEQGLPPIPIIAMTANAMQGDKERCLAEGMQGYVPKPVNPEQLRQEIQRVMQPKELATNTAQQRSTPEPKSEWDALLDQADNLLAQTLHTPSDSSHPAPERPLLQPQPPKIDWPLAVERLGGDAGLLRMALDMFIDEYEQHQRQLIKAWQEVDLPALAAEAHTLKSLLATFAAQEAEDKARQLEASCHQALPLNQLEPLYFSLLEALETLLPELLHQQQMD
ncbi:response regulator [Marinospirillum sp. MEB164]|uniref:histidine kinase n=1 Tax=Marinospirillum alkalitolerans TaxID=3123374 RepID=A0ABW8PVF4_9GAMM